MKNLAIPEEIQESVQKYLDYTQSTCDHQKELDRFLKMISPSLRELVIKHISLQAIAINDVFKDKSEVLDMILPDLTTLLFTPEDYVIRQEEAADLLYFVCRGEWEVLVSDESQKEKLVSNSLKIYRFVNSSKETTLGKLQSLKTEKEQLVSKARISPHLLLYQANLLKSCLFDILVYSIKWTTI